MNISIFDVIGPIMVGPSSSHTAGAARLAKIANDICYKPFYKVTFGLHGSFAETGLGHGTDKALLAGTLGFLADDERRTLTNTRVCRASNTSFTKRIWGTCTKTPV